ncbi:MAG: molybdopterin cofactor-binding domain-containing protein [Bacteroidota bacterium]
MGKKKFSRRKFIARTLAGSGGLFVGLSLTGYIARNPIRRQINKFVDEGESPYQGDISDPMLWFEVTADNKLTLFSPKVEMGQGSFTSLAQIAADELELDMSFIKVAHAQSGTGNLDQFATGGSTTIRGLWQPLRVLSATLREMLKAEAARKLDVPVSSLKMEDGKITDGSRSLTLGEVVEGVEEWVVPEAPAVKDVTEYTRVGKPVPRVDLNDKVFGAPIFGMDAEMPGMLYGAIVRSTRVGARFMGADTSKAEGMPGVVKVVLEQDFVAVVAASYTQAIDAKRKIEPKWEVDRSWTTGDIEEMITVGKGQPYVIQKNGSPAEILNADGVYTAEYRSPIGAHAQIEPHVAVAHVKGDQADVKMSTQVVRITRDQVANRLGIDKENVNIVPAFLGGGFGGRLETPIATYAAVISKAVGRPVKCFYERQEEFQNDTFRPPTHNVLKAKLTDNGSIAAMEHNVSSGAVAWGSPMLPGFLETVLGADLGAWRGGMIQYGAIPDFQAISWKVNLPFATSWWRSLGLLANTFAVESFMDELAEQAGKDPVQFRLEHIQDNKAGQRLKGVIQAVTERSGYRDKSTNGVAMGFAASTDAATPVAMVAQVSMDGSEIRVEKVTCAMDPGLSVNPDQVKAQVEGCIIMGISGAVYERMYIEDGQLRPVIYGPYEMARMKHAPKEIDVILLQGDENPGAVGEPPLGPVGAAIANAVYRLTGERRREMPLSQALA